jgi:hypothetical protein
MCLLKPQLITINYFKKIRQVFFGGWKRNLKVSRPERRRNGFRDV